MRALVVLGIGAGVLFGFVLGFASRREQRLLPAARPVCEFDKRMAIAADVFGAHVADARQRLKAGKSTCDDLRSEHQQFESSFNFLVMVLGVYKSSLHARFDAVAEGMDSVRKDILSGKGCLHY